MVMSTKRKRWIKAVSGVWVIALLTLGSAQASVIASVDRSDIELNESFTLKITVDTAIDTEPDATALDADTLPAARPTAAVRRTRAPGRRCGRPSCS